MLRWAMDSGSDDKDMDMAGDEAEVTVGESGTVTLNAGEKGSAGDNKTFLKGKLRWEKGDDGRERVMDEDGNGSVHPCAIPERGLMRSIGL